jgi:hypothetical protein
VVTRGFRRPVPMLDLREEASVADATEVTDSATARAVPTGERAQG